MAYTTEDFASFNQLVNQDFMNKNIRDNLIALNADTHLEMPIGSIILWPTDDPIPDDWNLCDGSNSTETITDVFVRCAGSLNVGDSGGAKYTQPNTHSSHNLTQANAHPDHVCPIDSTIIGSTYHFNPYDYISLSGAGPASSDELNADHIISGGSHNNNHSGATIDGHSVHKVNDIINLSLPVYSTVYFIQKISETGSYTASRTWADGDTPTASQINTELKDNLNYLNSMEFPYGGVVICNIFPLPNQFVLCDGQSNRANLINRIPFAVGALTVQQVGGDTTIKFDDHILHNVTQPSNHNQHIFSWNDHVYNHVGGLSGSQQRETLDDHSSHSGQTFSNNDGSHIHTGWAATSGHTHIEISVLPVYTALQYVQTLVRFTNPRTWSDDELFSSSLWNTYVKDNITSLHDRLSIQHLIVIWSGSKASIPSGWHLCDGASGTIDLDDDYVLGASDSFLAQSIGGSSSQTLLSHSDHSIHQPDPHLDHALLTYPNNHSIHFAYASGSSNIQVGRYSNSHNGDWSMSGHGNHGGMSVDSHSAHSALATVPPYKAYAYIERNS